MKINLGQFKRFEKQVILKKIGLAGQKKIFSDNAIRLLAKLKGVDDTRIYKFQ